MTGDRLAIAACGVVAALGCENSPIDTQVSQPARLNFSMSDPQSTTCGGTGNDGEFNGVDGTCLRGHATIDLTVTVPFAVGLGPVTQALAEWNAMLAHVPQMPTLRIVDSGGIPLVVHSNASSYCGRTSGGRCRS